MALVNNLKKKQETTTASKAPETTEEPKPVIVAPADENTAPKTKTAEADETEGDHTNAAQIYKMAKALVSDLKFMRKKAAKGDSTADWNGMIKSTTEEYIKAVRRYAGLDK